MAAPFMSEVEFKERLPLIDIIVREVTLTAGMVVACQPAGVDDGVWRFSNRKAAMVVDLMPYVEGVPPEYLYVIASDPFSKWNPYLHNTLLLVLQKLGGKFDDQLPSWAGLPWLVAQKDWNPYYLKGLEAFYKR